MKLTVLPLTPERWPDLEALFNAKGCSVARGCWCMHYRRSSARGSLPSGTTRAQPVWSVICFVVPSEYRGQGVAQALLDGAIAYARKRGATLLEACPVDKPGRSGDDQMWFGAKSMYDRAGFKEVARRKPRRPVVRLKPA
ncbi:GNAT family N-acetyltransferase [Variovorax paradoxus]|nr:GNAT family N-acetyltransferase [Variovorax paradoxus]MBT2303682.1 GNAT family N-acetyltransferase [Variovorax paradoxus]